MTQTTRRVHDYLSTYCWHENHGECRLTCKTCARPCRCECHSGRQRLETAADSDSASQPGGKDAALDLTARPEKAPECPMPGTHRLELVEDGLYRNPVGGELRLIEPAYRDTTLTRSFETLAPGLWVAVQQSILGTRFWLVTAEGMAECGYFRVTEEPTS